MSTAIATMPTQPALDRDTVAKVLLSGDLEKLTDTQRMAYCTKVCESLGLNPLTQPFAFIKLNGKLVMYAKKDATEQLRKIHGVSITSVTSQRVDDVFIVTANATDRSGRMDASTGAVALGTLKGEALANALMKAETKAKRRVTLSICGLGILDETETETIPNAQPYTVEAPKLETAPPMPAGTCRILKVAPKRKGNFEWAEVTAVSDTGEEKTANARGAQLIALCEQFAQNNVLCEITVKVNGKGNAEIEEVSRFVGEAVPDPTPQPEPVL